METQPQYDMTGLNLPGTDMLSHTALDKAVSEMFNDLKIDMITDLTEDEIKLITRIYMVSELKGIKIYKSGVKHYLRLLLSKKRKSRSELLQAIEGAQKRTTFLDKLFNRGQGEK